MTSGCDSATHPHGRSSCNSRGWGRGANGRRQRTGRGGAQRKMRTPGRSPQSTPGGGAGENEPRHALFGSELDLLDRVRHKSRNDRKVALAMGDGKTTEEGQRRVAQAAAALNG